MEQLEKYKVILWDFDGVIMDSMSVRDLGFRKVLESSHLPDEIDRLIKFHRENGGLSRYVKFRYFFEKIKNEEVSEEKILKLSDKFSEIMLSLLIDESRLISDSLEFIHHNFNNYTFHIVSGSDGVELNKICKALKLSDFFKTIQGSPVEKNQLVRMIMEDYHYKAHEVCLIGDSVNDLEAANVNGIDFWGYNNDELKNGPYIIKFK